MKCQMLFSGKNISKCCLLKILPRVLSVKRSYFVERVPGRFGPGSFRMGRRPKRPRPKKSRAETTQGRNDSGPKRHGTIYFLWSDILQ